MRIIYLIIALTMVCACTVSKELAFCFETGTVVDHTDLDGCGSMLESQSGALLLPIGQLLELITPNTKVKFSYKEVDMASTCMRENKVVQLSCLQTAASVLPCTEIREVQMSDWLTAEIDQVHPAMVIRYRYLAKPLYHLVGQQLDRWYDCHGQLVCADHAEDLCRIDRSRLENKVEIYVAHR